uniref:Dynamin N-terminal domain-containing protein n=1 Tax=Prevotella sp. GTC17254 TaxID=3236794 RepID=A0AB33J0L6_9BACT
MATNLFEEFKLKKEKMSMLADKAFAAGIINEEKKEEIKRKLDNDTLTIGVIGQMKCGKSTFLNSFVFGRNVLPAATTPMTAALSVITYGEKEAIEAEFYTDSEWQEQQMMANRSLEEVAGNELLTSKIKAAKELVSKAHVLGNSINSLLGKTQADELDNLEAYVGADGKYVSITKSVKIYYPNEALRGVEIVDTPGFNDPIQSREERTKDFLSKADAVLLMLYAGRPFDATDRAILFKNVGQCGMGKVLIGINKYDIPYESGETEQEIQDYVSREIALACREEEDNELKDILQSTTPITLSAEMALLSELPFEKIQSSEAFNHAWKRACDIFEISTQTEMRQKSHIDNLITAVKQIIEKEKGEILFKKPINTILASGNKLLADIDNEITKNKYDIELLNSSDDEIDEKGKRLNKVERRISSRLDTLGEDIEYGLRYVVRKGSDTLEDIVDTACNKMVRIVDNKGRLESADSINQKLESCINTLLDRDLKRSLKRIADDARRPVINSMNDFFDKIGEILVKYPPTEDFYADELLDKAKKEVDFTIDGNPWLPKGYVNNDDWGILDLFGNEIYGILKAFTLGAFGKFLTAFTHDSYKIQAKELIEKIRNSFDPKEKLNLIYNQKEEVIAKIIELFIDKLIHPLQAQIEDVRNNIAEREAKLEKAKNNLEANHEQKNMLEKKVEEIRIEIESLR